MGSFNVTCGLSGLSIEYKDPVMFMFLHEQAPSYNRDPFFNNPYEVRNLPIKGIYDSYGRVGDWDEDDPCLELLLRGLEVDLVEMGMGENTVHDLPVKKGTGLEEYLQSAHSRRLMVYNVYSQDLLKDLLLNGEADVEALLKIDLHCFTDMYAPNENTSHHLRTCLVRKDVWDAYISVAKKYENKEDGIGGVPADPALHERSTYGKEWALPLGPGAHLNMVKEHSEGLKERAREFLYVTRLMESTFQEFVPSLYAGQEVHYKMAADIRKNLAKVASKIQKDRK